MSLRTTSDFTNLQEERIKKLIGEGIRGETKMDTLPNKSFPLREEAEVMYFKYARDFLKTSLADRIMQINQDIYIGEKNEQGLSGIDS
ncbi:MAG: hypothetical protein IJA27_04845 [Lachnospiraceae bacterium]|nr:hypothetical protein [Lachnospiraceae bacterium]